MSDYNWSHNRTKLLGMGEIRKGQVGQYPMPSAGVMDDTVLFHSTLGVSMPLMDVAFVVIGLLGHKCNTKKFALLMYAPHRALTAGTSRWGAAEVKSKLHSRYVRLLGGNINLERGHHYAHRQLKNTCKKLKASFCHPQPSHSVAQQVIRGVALNTWIFRVQVKIPPKEELPERSRHCRGSSKQCIMYPSRRHTPWPMRQHKY